MASYELVGFDAIEAAPLAAAAPAGLAIAADQVATVIDMLQEQIESLEQSTFPVDGTIAPGAFGMTDRSPLLDELHARAHGAVMETVRDLLDDLLGFQDAVTEAVALVKQTDVDTAAELTAILTRTEDLDMGSSVYVDLPIAVATHPGPRSI